MSSCHGARVDDRAGGVGRSIGAVGAGREHGEALTPAQFQSRGEGQLLTAPSPPLAAHRHRRLAARDETGRRLERTRPLDQLARDPARLAVELTRQEVRPVAEPRGRRARRVGHQGIVADDQVGDATEDRIARLRRLLDFAAKARLDPVEDRDGRPDEDPAPLAGLRGTRRPH